MSKQGPTSDEPSDQHAEAARRRRRARVFGNVLPDQTLDEVADNGEDAAGESDDWLRRQKPPHHG